MRLALLAALALIPTVAHADDNPRQPRSLAITAPTAGETPCARLIDPDPNNKPPGCRAIATRKVRGLGTATLWRTDDGYEQHFAIAVTSGATTMITDRITITSNGCGMGKCENLDKVKPTLVATAVDGHPAIGLDLAANYSMSYHDPPHTGDRWTVHTFALCGTDGGGAAACVTASFGARGGSCKAALDANGAIHTSCDETVPVSFVQ